MPSPSRHFRGFTTIELPAVRSRGFTIIELMVAISIIAILVALLIPAMGAMGSQTREAAAVNAIGIAAEMARVYSIKDRPRLNLDPSGQQGNHRGAAALFTPSGEIRLIETDQVAQYSTTATAPDYGYLQLYDYDGTNLRPDPAVGFKDIASAEYITMPKAIRIQGIGRNSTGAVQLLDPPFAIRFDEHGHQLTATEQNTPAPALDRMVIYDGNLDASGLYDPTDRRGSYNYDTFVAGISGEWDSTAKKHRLPFERIESVVGVRVYDPNKPTEYRDIYFSRYSGTPMRND